MKALTPLAILAIAVPAYAQTYVSLKPAATSFASRGNLGAGAGEVLMGLHKSHWRGLGDNGTDCRVRGFRYTLQDSDQTTSEAFSIVIRSGTDANGPTTGAAGLLHKFGPLGTPSDPAGGGAAWIFTSTLASPVTIPCEDHVAVGLEFPPITSGTDFLLTQGSDSTLAAQHANADDMAWQIVGTAATASHPGGKRSWAMAVRVDQPTLQMSNNGLKTIGGMFPLVGGTYAGTISGAEAAATSLLFLSLSERTSGFSLLPGTARLYVDTSPLKLLTTVTTDTSGNATHTLATVPSVTPTVKFWFQAAIIGTTDQLTNAQAATFDQ